MKYWKSLGLFILTVIFVACTGDENTDEEQIDNFDRGAMLINWADNIIIPAYTAFNSSTTVLQSKTTTFIDSPSSATLQEVREAWENSYLLFQQVSIFEIGKAEELNYRNRLNAYPTNASEIEGYIASGSYDFNLPSTIDAQGFPAIDYILYGLGENEQEIISFYTTHANSEGYKNYLLALSETIATLSNAVLTDWTSGFRDSFVANTSSSATGSVDRLVNDYLFYYEKSLRAGKVGIPAGVFSNNPLPQNVEGFYKKDISKLLLTTALNATRDFFNGVAYGNNGTGASLKSYLDFLNTIKNGEDLSLLINNQFGSAQDKINALDSNLSQQVMTDNSKMLATYDELQRNVVLLKVDMLQALNINIDFVDADGD